MYLCAMDTTKDIDATISFKLSEDGSPTLYNAALDETYHSIHGAREESLLVFLDYGLRHYIEERLPKGGSHPINIYEAGFGTGLNALLSWQMAERLQQPICYYSVELYPVETTLWQHILSHLEEGEQEAFRKLHQATWNEWVELSPLFAIHKRSGSILEEPIPENLDVCYWDAFSPEKQPELWSREIFQKIYEQMQPQGVLTTYSSKGIVKTALKEAGFELERLKGPAFKRHVLRALKPSIEV